VSTGTVAGEGPPFHGEWSDELERGDAAVRALLLGQAQAERSLLELSGSTLISSKLITDLHEILFDRLFPHFAGKIRGPSPAHIPYWSTIGSLARALPPDEVPAAFEVLADTLARATRELDSLSQAGDPSFDEEFLRVAAYAHCELIRIHPFVNGNGRLSRLVVNYFFVRFTGLPIAVVKPPIGLERDAYLLGNAVWIKRRSLDAFVDFLRPKLRREEGRGN
jgi:Fic family protein